ncbi:MFS transporter [Chloroflexota bacterium]
MQSSPSPTSQPSFATRTPFFYGWVILAVSSLGLFISGPGQTYSISLFVDPIITDLGWSRTFVSGLYTAGSLTAGVAMIMMGRLLDHYGARIMMTLVGVLFGFAALWMSSVEHPIELYAGFTLLRIMGQGSLTLIPTTLISLWFIRNRGKAMAISSLGMAASTATFPLVIHALVASIGWRNAWIVLAFTIWALLLVPAVLLIRQKPESVGLLPDGQSPGQARSGQTSLVREVNFSLREAMRTRSFWMLLFAGSSFPLIITALSFHHISFLTGKGVTPGVAASVFSVIALMNLFGNFVAGFLADRFPNRYLLATGQVLLAMAMLWTFAITSSWQALFYGALLGLSGGFVMNIGAVIWPNYYGREHLGSIRGVTTAGMVISAALGPLPFGLLFDLTNSYSLAILIFLVLPVASAIAAFIARPPQKDKVKFENLGV